VVELSPALVLSMWAGGMAGGAAIVAWWREVGPGFSWLVAAVVGAAGLAAAFVGDNEFAYLGSAMALSAGVLARRPRLAAAFFTASALATMLGAVLDAAVLPVLTGAALLGGITVEMMLGHWYLIDPRLPRWTLQRLDAAAGAGLVADFLLMVLAGALDWGPGDAVLGWAFVALSLMTFLLIIAVWYSLLEPSYTGVMAATGLSYLAVLTGFGGVVLGRLLTSA
jgi:hypothetical protein